MKHQTTPSVAQELRDAARAIRRGVPMTASFHREVATLLDQIAMSAPVVEVQLPPITRKALAVARAFANPGAHALPSVPPKPEPLEIPLKPCGCGVLLGEVCSCPLIQAEAEAAFVSPLKVGWTR